MEHAITEQDGAIVVALKGEVDLEQSPRLRKLLLEAVAKSKPLFVDLSEVRYIDSSGVASLVETYQTARRNGTKFGLAAVSAPALRVLELARLNRVFTIHGTVADAVASAR